MSEDDLFEALRAGDAERVRGILERRPALASERDATGLSPVMWALYNRKEELVPLLLGKAPALDVFEAAALGRDREVDAHLARDPASATAFAADGFTPLHLAAFFRRDAIARMLVARGAEVRAVAKNPSRVEPVHSAAAAGSAPIVELLLEAGADPNARQHGGFAPLHSAVMQANVAVVRALVARGADAELAADDGRTPRTMAGERADVIEALYSADRTRSSG